MRKLFLSVFFVLGLAVTVQAQTICPLNGQPFDPKKVASLKIFREIAVLDNGRIKPMDTYARNVLLQFSGKTRVEKTDALVWFAELLFAPQVTKDDKVFLINHPEIAENLSIEVEKHRRYSYAQLEPKLEELHKLYVSARAIEDKERDVVEKEIVRLYENVALYTQLSLSYSFAFPTPAFTVESSALKTKLELDPKLSQFSYIDVALHAQQLRNAAEGLERKDQSQWDDQDQEMMGLMVNLYQSANSYVNLPQTIIPSYGTNDASWFSPWDALRTGLADESGRRELMALRDMMIAYWNGQQLPFDMAAKAFNVSVKKRLDAKGVELRNKVPLEIFYNKANLFFLAKTIYLLAIFLFLYSLAVSNGFLRRLLWVFSFSAIAMHLLAVIIRIILLGRPPVSNLYETFVFVGLIGALAGLLIEKFNRQGLGFLVSGVSGFVFLTIAGKFAADGDTLQMLVAVLNSNFWLSTHVISITTGYAGVCVAGIVGHFYLLQAIFKPQQKEALKKTYSVLLGTLAFGLIMTFLGTNLGGIWADQSWGRFWGWDPKENGALLIVLWTIILFHAKIAKLIHELGMAVGSVLGIIVVMWAWFGVNLLSIGLHSYGFTSGLARNLMIYFCLQLLFIFIAAPLAYKNLKK